MQVVISPRARTELETIFADTVERWGAAQARTYTDALIATFDRIASRDVVWRAVAPELGKGRYRQRCGRHLIYWRADEVVVTIVAILHASMDQAARLNR